ncbi:MAG: hypothetical protein II969_11810 [Anaerolineaceae bacterium]|nr:hypothetical protein [Anaerolineaceae bacterium]
MKTRILFILLTFALLASVLPAFAEEELLWSNFNTGAVQSGPKIYSGAPMKKDTEPVLITKVRTYHWNNGNGAAAGTISICEDELDNVIGSWQAIGRSGSGRQNVFWEALVDCVMYPGHNYFVKVSDKDSWSYNDESEGGFYELYGIFPAPEGSVDPARLSHGAAGTFSVGQTFTMGRYEQDNNLNNGPEPIEWQVLAMQSDRILVVSKYGLDVIHYYESLTDISWEYSYARRWLNETFYNIAFNAEDRGKILLFTNENPNNPEFGTYGGNRTQDFIFLLNIDEANRYFSTDKSRLCIATPYSKTYGIFVSEKDGGTSWWWLRSPGESRAQAAVVNPDGSVQAMGYGVQNQYGVIRPAFWLKTISQPAPTPVPQTCYRVTYAGNTCLSQVPLDNKCYQLGDLVTILFEPVEYMPNLIFNGWDIDGDNVADFGYNYPTFAMPNHDVELRAVCYQQYQDHGYSQYGVRTGEVDPYYNQQQYYNPYGDPTLNGDIYDPNTGWWYDPDYYYGYDGVG